MEKSKSCFDAKNIESIIKESAELFASITEDKELQNSVLKSSELIIKTLKNGGKILLCGNGGSAADAQHFAGEMVGSFMIKNRAALSAIALNSDTSILTSIGNDSCFEEIFSKQVQALGRAEDVLIGISTSGNSKNIIKAFDEAKCIGMKLIALCGAGGQMPEMADIAMRVPSTSTPRIQEIHSLLIHLICGYVEAELFKNE